MIQLLLPALFPSWRFFSVIGPSPRIEYAIALNAFEAPTHWQPFRPRPAHLSVGRMLQRLLWNPDWNEALYLVTCAERLLDDPTDHSLQEIRAHVIAQVRARPHPPPFLQFRLVLVSRSNDQILRQTAYVSDLIAVEAGG